MSYIGIWIIYVSFPINLTEKNWKSLHLFHLDMNPASIVIHFTKSSMSSQWFIECLGSDLIRPILIAYCLRLSAGDCRGNQYGGGREGAPCHSNIIAGGELPCLPYDPSAPGRPSISIIKRRSCPIYYVSSRSTVDNSPAAATAVPFSSNKESYDTLSYYLAVPI